MSLTSATKKVLELGVEENLPWRRPFSFQRRNHFPGEELLGSTTFPILINQIPRIKRIPHVFLDCKFSYQIMAPTCLDLIQISFSYLNHASVDKLFQGKKATLASHERESSTKILDESVGLSEVSFSHGPHWLDEFKSRLRMSFKVLIQKPSYLHLLSAVQAIERALVGVQEDNTMIYQISTGSGDGGKVSSTVAAGIDCLDLIIEYAQDRKRLNVVKRHIQNLIAALFNIIVHLQSPIILYEKQISCGRENIPDPGSVILMCIEVLTRVSGNHALFQMDSWHVAQSLHVPVAIFQDIHKLSISEAPVPSNFVIFSDDQNSDIVASQNSIAVDRQFSINLFAACCRLLYTVLKHHKR
ncbi:hypothetical protein WN943_024962 [Citrus x changshan-huyou]